MQPARNARSELEAVRPLRQQLVIVLEREHVGQGVVDDPNGSLVIEDSVHQLAGHFVVALVLRYVFGLGGSLLKPGILLIT